MFRSDEYLVKECLEGAEDAWIELIGKYRALIYSIPIKYGISPADAGEIFQQVCAKLVEELPNLRQPNCIAAWLIKTTTHGCSLWSRRASRYQSIDDTERAADPAAPFEPPDLLLVELEKEQMLREALETIDLRCQELIRMLFFETPAKPYHEVARSLRLARGSIGFIRMRCLQRVRRALETVGFR